MLTKVNCLLRNKIILILALLVIFVVATPIIAQENTFEEHPTLSSADHTISENTPECLRDNHSEADAVNADERYGKDGNGYFFDRQTQEYVTRTLERRDYHRITQQWNCCLHIPLQEVSEAQRVTGIEKLLDNFTLDLSGICS